MKDGKHVVLHIDDDPEFIDSMRLILEKGGYILEEAASSEEGIKQFKETKPDFVIVDLSSNFGESTTNLPVEQKRDGRHSRSWSL